MRIGRDKSRPYTGGHRFARKDGDTIPNDI